MKNPHYHRRYHPHYQVMQTLLVGGILPVVAFSVIEGQYGTMWGLVAGMAFGVGEIAYEAWTQGRVEPLTWGGNGLILVLGGVSLVTQEGIWFKLQPSLIEAAMALALWGSVLIGKPILTAALKKQLALQVKTAGPNLHPNQLGPPTPRPEIAPVVAPVVPPVVAPIIAPTMARGLSGMTARLGVFFALHAALATWAALHWSTAAWAALKGIGLTVSTIVYMLAESLVLRYRVAQSKTQRF